MKKYIIILFCLEVLLSACNTNLKREYYPDGSLKKTYYQDKNKKKYGLAVEYYNNGIIKWQSYYVNDTVNGICKKYYSNGQLEVITNLVKNNQDGIIMVYYENGKLKQCGQYRLGKKNGFIRNFYQNGSRKNIIFSKNDVVQYVINYDSLGTITNNQHLIELSFLNKLSITDSLKVRAKVLGFYDNGKTPVFAMIEKRGGVIEEGLVPKMRPNAKDSCYYYAFPPQKHKGKYLIKISLLIDNKMEFEQQLDTIFTIE